MAVRWANPENKADPVARLFRASFQAEPEGVWAAPGRINVIGEHVDYNEGFCLPAALPHRTFAAIRRRRDDQIRLVSEQMPEHQWHGRVSELAAGSVDGWAAYVAGVLWALRTSGVDVPGVDVAVGSSVPVGAGLSSSAALECSVAIGLAELLGLPTDDAGRHRLSQACIRAENDMAGANTGGMDQAISLRAQTGKALLLDCRTGAVTHVPFALKNSGLDLLVMDTNAPHQLVDGQYAARRADCERAASLLGVPALRDVDHLDTALADLRETAHDDVLVHRVRHVVTEIGRVHATVHALGTGAWPAVGSILDQSHASLRDDYEVSCPELDAAVAAAVQAGALGARMVGGGFGGSAIALVKADQAESVATAVAGAFAERGFAEPTFLPAPASAGAGRVR